MPHINPLSPLQCSAGNYVPRSSYWWKPRWGGGDYFHSILWVGKCVTRACFGACHSGYPGPWTTNNAFLISRPDPLDFYEMNEKVLIFNLWVSSVTLTYMSICILAVVFAMLLIHCSLLYIPIYIPFDSLVHFCTIRISLRLIDHTVLNFKLSFFICEAGCWISGCGKFRMSDASHEQRWFRQTVNWNKYLSPHLVTKLLWIRDELF